MSETAQQPMEYRIEIDHENRLIIGVGQGVLDLKTTALMTRGVSKQAYELGYDRLYDLSEMQVGIGYSDAYDVPRDLSSLYENPLHRLGRVAIVYKTKKDFWEFFEVTAQNAGLDVRIFSSLSRATEWLKHDRANTSKDRIEGT